MQGNVGEWTEAYVFLRLLAEGQILPDQELQNLPGASLPILKVIREENSGKRDYVVIEDNIHVIDAASQKLISKISRKVFSEEADRLFNSIKNAEGRSHTFPDTEAFLKSIDVNSLSAPSMDKSDIHMMIYDSKTGQTPTLGFSIKSTIGKNATLFNPAAGTNFIYRIIPPAAGLDFQKINTETYYKAKKDKNLSKISLRINELLHLGCKIQFEKIQSDNLHLNLSLIETQLPEILSHVLFLRYKEQTAYMKQILDILDKENPLSYNQTHGHKFYRYRLKKFLTDAALGMTPEKVWNGLHDATGGFIIARPDGKVGCYNIYNKNVFEEYLVTQTKLEQPATSEDENNPGFAEFPAKKPYKFGWIYEDNSVLYIKLNLQVRFL